jgi:hypothetical protein
VIYVAGLGHSGSTLLDLLLGTAKKAVSLGQIWTVLREDPSKSEARICTCGAPAPECIFWRPILKELKSSHRSPESDRYRAVVARAEDLYGPKMAIIDSSKQVANLAILSRLSELRLFVLHNVKDVRAFTVSMIDNAVRKSTSAGSPERLFLQWYRTNRAVHSEVSKRQGQPPLRISYEAICFATQTVADRVSDRLGDRYIDAKAALNSGLSHIISGNRFWLSNSNGADIAYDSRWFGRSEWLRPYVLMPMVRKYNEECLREWDTFSAPRS